MAWAVKCGTGSYYSGRQADPQNANSVWGASAARAHRFVSKEAAEAFARGHTDRRVEDVDELVTLKLSKADISVLDGFLWTAEWAAGKLAVEMARGCGMHTAETDALIRASGERVRLGRVEPVEGHRSALEIFRKATKEAT